MYSVRYNPRMASTLPWVVYVLADDRTILKVRTFQKKGDAFAFKVQAEEHGHDVYWQQFTDAALLYKEGDRLP